MTQQIIDEEITINASVSAVWEALTNPKITEQYWGGTQIESDWQKGSFIYYRRDGEITDKHILLEISPKRFIEHTFNPVFGEFKDEAPSLVSLLLKENGNTTDLRVLHRNFPPESKVYSACKEGWPEILKALKMLLENKS